MSGARRAARWLLSAGVLAAACVAGCLLLGADPALADAAALRGDVARGVSAVWAPSPLLQERPPVERRVRASVRGMIANVRWFFKRTMYLVTHSPNWWGRRARNLVWPVVFALAALFFDTSLLSAWKSDGFRVLTTYVPMMLYVYSSLFVSRGVPAVTRIGVLVALVYGVWRHDVMSDGRWSRLGVGRIDDLVVVALAVRAFVATCPEQLVARYAGRAIAIRNRITGAASSPG